MSVEQYQRNVNSIDSEILKLQDKKAKIDKKYAELQKKKDTLSSAAERTKSDAAFKSKKRQIDECTKMIDKLLKESADLGKKIADKTKKRNEVNEKLQKAGKQQEKKKSVENRKMKDSYEKRIRELENHAIDIVQPDYISLYHESVEEYDVFISHAWEDKASFADEFVQELGKLDIKVWYDSDKILWGGSMRAKIDEGLKRSKFGIAVISPNYIAEEKYWTKAELDGLFQLESINGKIILPIWHNISKQEIMDFSPILANKKALSTATMTIREIAQEMRNLLDKE